MLVYHLLSFKTIIVKQNRKAFNITIKSASMNSGDNMNYMDILNSDYFKKTYATIEELKKDFPVNHGFIHVYNVINNAKRLAQTFHLNEHQKELLLLAASLHDIGYLNGRDDHAYNGSILAIKILKEWGYNDKDTQSISIAIANHGGKKKEDYLDIISMCLIIADKLDFINTRYDTTRLKEDYLTTFPYIKETYIDYLENEIILNIKVTKEFNLTIFENSSYYRKLESFLYLLSDRLNSSYKIQFIIV